MAETIVIWRPQPGPQVALLTCPVFEVFYGGARGGGKTDGSIWRSKAREKWLEVLMQRMLPYQLPQLRGKEQGRDRSPSAPVQGREQGSVRNLLPPIP